MRAALVAAPLLLAMPAGAAAAPELVKLGEFSEPVALAAPPNDGSRMFVAERGGTVRLLRHGVPAPAPFADLTSHVPASAGCSGSRSHRTTRHPAAPTSS